jgi:serine protease inhibitor
VSDDNLKQISQNRSSLRVREVDVKLPRFKVTHELKLSGILKDMGVQLPFTSEADFSGMVDSGSSEYVPFALTALQHTCLS